MLALFLSLVGGRHDTQAAAQARSSLQTLFERVYSGPVLSSQHMLEAGLINVGDTRRIERAMQKLIHGTFISLSVNCYTCLMLSLDSAYG